MYTQVFQVTVSLGPPDWRPYNWDYGWSFWYGSNQLFGVQLIQGVSPRPSIMSLMKKAQSSHVLAGLGFGVQSPDTGLIGIA